MCLPCNQETPFSYLNSDTNYPFYLQTLQAHAGIVPEIRPHLIPSTYFWFSTIIHSFDTVTSLVTDSIFKLLIH